MVYGTVYINQLITGPNLLICWWYPNFRGSGYSCLIFWNEILMCVTQICKNHPFLLLQDTSRHQAAVFFPIPFDLVYMEVFLKWWYPSIIQCKLGFFFLKKTSNARLGYPHDYGILHNSYREDHGRHSRNATFTIGKWCSEWLPVAQPGFQGGVPKKEKTTMFHYGTWWFIWIYVDL